MDNDEEENGKILAITNHPFYQIVWTKYTPHSCSKQSCSVCEGTIIHTNIHIHKSIPEPFSGFFKIHLFSYAMIKFLHIFS